MEFASVCVPVIDQWTELEGMLMNKHGFFKSGIYTNLNFNHFCYNCYLIYWRHLIGRVKSNTFFLKKKNWKTLFHILYPRLCRKCDHGPGIWKRFSSCSVQRESPIHRCQFFHHILSLKGAMTFTLSRQEPLLQHQRPLVDNSPRICAWAATGRWFQTGGRWEPVAGGWW